MIKKPSLQLHIGSSFPRDDAYSKVCGETRFASDFYNPEMIWVGAKRAGVPHAQLINMHLESARAVPGIIAILTSKDIPGINKQGVIRKDQPVLISDRIRHCGDPVALVLAESKLALKTALELIELNIEHLPGIFSIEDALKAGSILIHEDHPQGNTLLKAEIVAGKGKEALDESDFVIRECFRTPMQEHAYLETECGWAIYEDGKLTIECSTQTPFRDRMETAEVLGMNPLDVRIIVPYVGGAFGGKDGVTVQTLLGLAALHSPNKPVKMWLEREESFISGTKRHSAIMDFTLGAKENGKLHYLEAHISLDTGPYDHLGGVVLALACEHAGGAYHIPNCLIKGLAVYTNNPIGGAFRGFGVPQVTSAIEQLMNKMANTLKMNPIDFRLQNALKIGATNCVGKTITRSIGISECLLRLKKHPLYVGAKKWKQDASENNLRGIGLASLMQASGYGPIVPDVANAKLELNLDGKITIFCGIVDMGQGNASTNLQLAGAILNQESSQLQLILPDTDATLPSGSASASRCTYAFGNALIGAANLLSERIRQRAADFLFARDTNQIALIPGFVKNLENGKTISLSALANMLTQAEKVVTYRFRSPVAQDNLNLPDILRLHGLPHTMYTYGAHLALVEVDQITGSLTIVNYLAVTDAGMVLNPQIYEQQIQGGIAQSIGLTMMEDFEVQHGSSVNSQFFYLSDTYEHGHSRYGIRCR